MKELIVVYKTELIKTKNSFAFWLLILGALFIPAFFTGNVFYHWDDYLRYLTVESSNPWNEFSRKLFNGVHFSFLPLLIVLIIALVVNIEHKSNTWKHIFVLPVSKTNTFIAKYMLLFTLLLLFYLLLSCFYLLGGYSLGIWKTQFGFLNHAPSYAYGRVQTDIVAYLGQSFVTVLAILAIHFWLSFRIKNLFPTIAIGLGGVVITLGMYISHWHSLIYMPYGFPVLMCNFIPQANHFLTDFQSNSLLYFAVVASASYIDFVKFFKG
ncbi:MAG: ABC transporter permease [Flavisolibacter sp.]